jgi:hypothetical protein
MVTLTDDNRARLRTWARFSSKYGQEVGRLVLAALDALTAAESERDQAQASRADAMTAARREERELRQKEEGEYRGAMAEMDEERIAAIARAETAEREVERLRAALAVANENHERFERLWYLATDKLEEARAVLGALGQWTHEFGAALRPTGADTYGEGVRAAKAQVARILVAQPAASEPADEPVERGMYLAGDGSATSGLDDEGGPSDVEQIAAWFDGMHAKAPMLALDAFATSIRAGAWRKP